MSPSSSTPPVDLSAGGLLVPCEWTGAALAVLRQYAHPLCPLRPLPPLPMTLRPIWAPSAAAWAALGDSVSKRVYRPCGCMLTTFHLLLCLRLTRC
ncbi:hypothetical protein OH77DRAFT_314702 [Trametes cingulata]|nr:hypothetical protein OH77DRAFT_314702 [Trametes cingulata]